MNVFQKFEQEFLDAFLPAFNDYSEKNGPEAAQALMQPSIDLLSGMATDLVAAGEADNFDEWYRLSLKANEVKYEFYDLPGMENFYERQLALMHDVELMKEVFERDKERYFQAKVA